MFAPGPSYAPPILQARNRDPRFQYFQALQQQGASTAPVSSPLEALARVAQAGLGGYFGGKVNQEYEGRQKQYQEALAQAMGQPDPIAALQQGGNADVLSQFGPQILQAKSQQAQRKEESATRAAERADDRAFTIQRDKTQQDWTLARDNLQAAKQEAMQNNSFENQMKLQRAQQAFADMQMKAQQGFQAAQQQRQQDFTAGENQKGRDLQGRQLEQGRIPPGYRMNAGGQLEAIPGSEAALKAAEKADTMREQAVASDRMIRSVNELIGAETEGMTPQEKARAAELRGQREWGTGKSAIFNVLPGTPGADFAAKLDTLKSQAFLPAVAQLKGMGALSEAEGKKLTAAIGALESTMSEGEFLRSLNQIKSDLLAARSRMGGGAQPQGAPAAGGWSIQKVQ